MKLTNLAQTVEQFKILNYIQENFDLRAFENENFELNIIDRNCIEVIDKNDSVQLMYSHEDKKVIWN